VNLDSLPERKLRRTTRYDKNLRPNEFVILTYADRKVFVFILIFYF